jgi:hypothetical protein
LQNIIDSGHKNCITKDDLVELNIIDHISIKKMEGKKLITTQWSPSGEYSKSKLKK